MIGVLWSIKYEWLFYLALPLIGLVCFRSGVPWPILLITIGIGFLIVRRMPVDWHNLARFGGGIAAAFLARSKKFCALASGKIASLLIIACLALTVIYFKNANELFPMALVSIAFIGIACGNSLFGALTARLSREFGQLSYGIYLLHGLFLFAVFHFFMSFEQAAKLTIYQHWLLISLIGAVLTTVCFLLHHYYELPASKTSSRITAFLRRSALFGKAPKGSS
jgi:peptidoglycan/LPS O-acetylase OafA/YrhL